MLESTNLFTEKQIEREFTVSEISSLIKQRLEDKFSCVRVKGEISGLKVHTSGHAYFTLKDENAVLDGICWRGVYSTLSIRPADGMEVICHGSITTYPRRSKYQIIIDRMELAGQGALLQLLEERKRKLAAEGLFASERKKPLPFLPKIIGVVTSPTGAVLRDIIHRIEDRFPCRVIVWPVLVQGQGAAEQIAAAINGFNKVTDEGMRPDLLIVGRGGGSLEDLWCFNDEIVVRAVVASLIPIISAVGHETDTTLIDYAADKRAPTPTAAAEMAVPVRLDILQLLQDRNTRLFAIVNRILSHKNTELVSLLRGLPNLKNRLSDHLQRFDDWLERFNQSINTFLLQKGSQLAQISIRLKHPKDILQQNQLRLINLNGRLDQVIKFSYERHQQNLQMLGSLLNSYSFHSTLQRGFAIIQNEDGKPVTSKNQTSVGQNLNVVFHDGNVAVEVRKS